MIIGNLGAIPEMRYTPNGRPVTQFNVAVNQSTKNQQTGEWVEETDWFRVSVWGDRAERAAENLRKGNRVFVEGRFKTREFEGRDGQKRTSLEITADSVVNLEKRAREGDEGQFSGAPGAAERPPAAALRRGRLARRRRPARRHRPRRPSLLTAPTDDRADPMPPRARLPPTKKRDDFYRDRRRRKVCAFCADKTGPDRLQGSEPPPPLPLGAGQDRAASQDRHLCRAPARARRRAQARPARRAAAVRAAAPPALIA